MHETNANISEAHPNFPRRNNHYSCDSSGIGGGARVDLRDPKSNIQVLLVNINSGIYRAGDEVGHFLSTILEE